MPGPSSTDSGFPVLKTGSPTVTPAVHNESRLHEYIFIYLYTLHAIMRIVGYNLVLMRFYQSKSSKLDPESYQCGDFADALNLEKVFVLPQKTFRQLTNLFQILQRNWSNVNVSFANLTWPWPWTWPCSSWKKNFQRWTSLTFWVYQARALSRSQMRMQLALYTMQ